MADRQTPRIYALINDLRNIGPTSNAKIKFILDGTPWDNDNQPSPSGDRIITGRLLPNSSIYAQGSIQIHIILGLQFPFKPPKVCLQTKVYHPNVSDEGEVSIRLLHSSGSWTPITTLISVVEEVTKIIDTPDIDLVQNVEAAKLYVTNQAEYERVASDTFNSNCSPRN